MKAIKLKTLVLAIAIGAATSSFAGLVNINKADSEAIAHHLAGIGNKKAEAIVKYRAEHGAFTDVGHLVNVKGIGEKILSKNLDDISLSQGAVAMIDDIKEAKKSEEGKKPLVISKEKASKTEVKPELSKKQKLAKLDSKDATTSVKKSSTKKVISPKVKSSDEAVEVAK